MNPDRIRRGPSGRHPGRGGEAPGRDASVCQQGSGRAVSQDSSRMLRGPAGVEDGFVASGDGIGSGAARTIRPRYLDPRIGGALRLPPDSVPSHARPEHRRRAQRRRSTCGCWGRAGIPLESLRQDVRAVWAGFALTAADGSSPVHADATKHASNPAFLREAGFRGAGGRRAGRSAPPRLSRRAARQAPCGRVARLLVRRAERGPPHGLRQRVRLVNLAHLHLLLNHVPTIGFAIGIGLLGAVARPRQSKDLRRASFRDASLVVALIGIPVYLSGNAAHFILRNTGDVSAGLVVAHQQRGDAGARPDGNHGARGVAGACGGSAGGTCRRSCCCRS